MKVVTTNVWYPTDGSFDLQPVAGCIASLEHAATKYDNDHTNLLEAAE